MWCRTQQCRMNRTARIPAADGPQSGAKWSAQWLPAVHPPLHASAVAHRRLLPLCLAELHFGSVTSLLSSYFPSLRSICLSYNQLERIPAFGSLPHLTSLQLRGNSIAHVEHLAACTSLRALDLTANRIQDLPILCAELM